MKKQELLSVATAIVEILGENGLQVSDVTGISVKPGVDEDGNRLVTVNGDFRYAVPEIDRPWDEPSGVVNLTITVAE